METLPETGKERCRLSLGGAVQGVGFRPFVYRLATELGLAGSVSNSSAGLFIEVEGAGEKVREFLERVETERPQAALILAREIAWLAPDGTREFHIVASDATPSKSAGILPDLATCEECRREFTTPGERRYGYPFTNCTRCGPRYTIVESIPYDRPNTTMRAFPLCDDCAREYADPGDRRFHAQPIACPRCGPRITLTIAAAAEALRAGLILALKGIGGYQLLCDARNTTAVARLRERKQREGKPFAVMCGKVEEYAEVSPEESRLLQSAAAPIVLLRPLPGTDLSPQVSGASPYLGMMLPYSPLHWMLLEAFPHPVVATSGNLSDEPIATDVEEAHERLGRIADVFLDHNRPIARACDDSVARVTAGRESVMRRARGYAPLPVRLRGNGPNILAVGGHLKSTVAIGRGGQAIVSQHIGDLETVESRKAFHCAIADLCRLYDFAPDVIACDSHPDYYSSQWAREQSKPVVTVQHHIAHCFSCAAENDIRGAYLGVAWDGTGYGLDGKIWGGEFFFVDGMRVERVAHLRPFLLPGGEKAVKQGWRTAAALLWAAGREADPRAVQLLERRLNCMETTSMGRLFDAVAALAGLTQVNRFEGHSGLLLEAKAAEATAHDTPEFDGDWETLLDWVQQKPAAEAAWGFHAALTRWIGRVAQRTGAGQVALSGGCFQNALLERLAREELARLGMRTFTHQRVPTNDGGISLGQLAFVAGSMTADIDPLQCGMRGSAP
jgi:hydrogenase maturation protein HypF